MGQTKTSNLEFLNRIGTEHSDQKSDPHADDGKHEDEHTDATVKLEEMLLVYPSSVSSNPDQMRKSSSTRCCARNPKLSEMQLSPPACSP